MPPEVMDELIDAVLRLVARGALNEGQGNSLIGRFQYACTTTAALNGLRAFVNEVKGLLAQGALMPEEGQALIEVANRIAPPSVPRSP
jgi:hypothetical protein